jgi:hypothetical protein
LFTDPVDLALDDQVVEGGEWQTHEEHNSSVKDGECLAKGALDLLGWPVNFGRIGNSPVGCQWMADPKRAYLSGGAVADSEYEVHLRCTGHGENIPALAV